jgi:hypothetical protein
MVTFCTDHHHPLYPQISNLFSEQVFNFFFRDPEQTMKVTTLGEALDMVSFGYGNVCCWESSISRLVDFVGLWMKTQDKGETVKGNYTWNIPKYTRNVNLPYIKLDKCPRERTHNERITDLSGRIRCAHVDYKDLKPSFIEELNQRDPYSMLSKTDFFEEEPFHPDSRVGAIPDLSDPSYQEYLGLQEKFDEEERVRVDIPCYAVLSDVGTILPLQKVFSRLSVARQGVKSGLTIFPFSGFDLANYVSAWSKQPTHPFKMNKGESDFYRAFPKFQPMGGED